MPLSTSELSSLSSMLEDIIQRISGMTQTLQEDDDDRVEIQEVERQLQTASRRLTKISMKQQVR